MEWKKLEINEYIFCDFIYIKFGEKKNFGIRSRNNGYFGKKADVVMKIDYKRIF